MPVLRRNFPLILLTLALTALGVLCGSLLVPVEHRAVASHLVGFPDSDVRAHQLRPHILAALCAIPALACLAYAMGGIFARYITRLFLSIFGICLSALFLIWLLLDLSDKISDFQNSANVMTTIGVFYLNRAPAVLVLLLPYSLLLSLLYCLGRLSSNHEIIAIIQSGRGVFRITLPLMTAGIFCTIFSAGLNYHWAPTAEGRQDEILAEASGKTAAGANHVLYRNAQDRRLWMIGAFPVGYEKGAPLTDVEITTSSPDHRIASRLIATHARWDRNTRHWTFINPMISRHQEGFPPIFEKTSKHLIMKSWSETPWQLIKPGLSAAYLGIPELNTWINSQLKHPSSADPAPYLTQWHYRWALPFTCLVTVLLATPLAIHFSRRGPGGGIFLAIVLSAIMMLVSTIVLAFGEAAIIHPALAAWIPNVVFMLLALYLFHRRISGRPIYHSLRKLLPVGSA